MSAAAWFESVPLFVFCGAWPADVSALNFERGLALLMARESRAREEMMGKNELQLKLTEKFTIVWQCQTKGWMRNVYFD